MPVPDYPVTRTESYLNAISQGSTSGIPTYPVTREEMYLDAIAKGGGGSGGGGVLVVGVNSDTMALDKTWKEITDAPLAVAKLDSGFGVMGIYLLSAYWSQENAYYVGFVAYNGNAMVELEFVATSETGYPVYHDPNA